MDSVTILIYVIITISCLYQIVPYMYVPYMYSVSSAVDTKQIKKNGRYYSDTWLRPVLKSLYYSYIIPMDNGEA